MADRHQFRADWHDYNDGIFFVTVCCAGKAHLFGSIFNDEIRYTDLGKIALEYLESIPTHHQAAELLNYVVMPNHIHLVISIAPSPVGARYIAPAPNTANTLTNNNLGCLKPPKHGDSVSVFHHNSLLASIMGSYKAAVTREYRRMMRARCIAPLPRIWQRLFHEHVIRDQHSFDNIMNYIDNNVANWSRDCFNTVPAQCLSHADTHPYVIPSTT